MKNEETHTRRWNLSKPFHLQVFGEHCQTIISLLAHLQAHKIEESLKSLLNFCQERWAVKSSSNRDTLPWIKFWSLLCFSRLLEFQTSFMLMALLPPLPSMFLKSKADKSLKDRALCVFDIKIHFAWKFLYSVLTVFRRHCCFHNEGFFPIPIGQTSGHYWASFGMFHAGRWLF